MMAIGILKRKTADAVPPLEDQLASLRQARDVDGLIELLKDAEKKRKKEVVQVLKELTGVDLGTKARIWKRWQKNRAQPAHEGGWTSWLTAVKALLALAFVGAVVRKAVSRFRRKPSPLPR